MESATALAENNSIKYNYKARLQRYKNEMSHGWVNLYSMDANTKYSARQVRDGYGGGFEITSDNSATPPPPPATTSPPFGAVFWISEQRF